VVEGGLDVTKTHITIHQDADLQKLLKAISHSRLDIATLYWNKERESEYYADL
jgi:hypothetical protein